jgi:arylsulfatase A-like enzyme
VVTGDEIGFDAPPVSALVLLLLACLSATLLYALVPRRPADGDAAGADGTLADASPVADSADDAAADGRPNIIVVYLDDMRASDLRTMDNVRELVAANGATFTNSVVTTASCCPARATQLSGQYAHNTGVMHNSPPYGGYVTFKVGKQAAGESLPIWLESAGYRTVFFGKFMNHYPHERDRYEVPPGFTDWYGLYEGAFRQANYSIYRQTRYAVRAKSSDGHVALDQSRAREVVPVAPRDGGGHVLLYDGEDVHQTAVLMNGAVDLLERDDGSRPLYMNLWLTAPHAGGDGPQIGGRHYKNKLRPLTVRPEQPELQELRALLRSGRDLGPFRLDRSASFNEDNVRDKSPFIRKKPKLTREQVADIEIRNALRLAAVKSVDRRIEELLAAVEEAERRTGRETYVVFSSDNGFFLGEHRLPYEKNWHYGVATDVPLVIRGPDVQSNAVIGVPVANIDLAPTLLDMAGAADSVATPLDGQSLLPLLERPAIASDPEWRQRAVLLEGFWGNTRRRRYAGVRTTDWVYVEHYAQTDGRTLEFTELYDRRDDPSYERNLLHGQPSSLHETIAWRLEALLERLRSCSGQDCHQRDLPMAVGPLSDEGPDVADGAERREADDGPQRRTTRADGAAGRKRGGPRRRG